MAAIPEFLLRKLIDKDSFDIQENGFSFIIHNSFAPATLTGFHLWVDGRPVPGEKILVRYGSQQPLESNVISPEEPLDLAVGMDVKVQVEDHPYGEGDLQFSIDTREAGELAFSMKDKPPDHRTASRRQASLFQRLIPRPLKVDVHVDAEAVIGEINPYVYGHFVEHLERCVYGGIWTEDGSSLRQDTLEWIRKLNPPIIRYPGGNFASGYHWQDGVGPKDKRPERYDAAWKVTESNQVGTDEFVAFCQEVKSDPFLVVNCGNGSAEEAADWVAYCNQASGEGQGAHRAANGNVEPYGVKIWGVGNEVWGPWQIGHSSAEEYAQRLSAFASAMRNADASIKLVAVGDKVQSDRADDPGRLWNEEILRHAGDQIDYLSFHLYQPDQSGWQESYDLDELHHIVCAAPLDAEKMMQRMAAQIQEIVPQRDIRIAFDEWNLWLPPPEGAKSMHQVEYCMRDALYTAGMLNVFHRQCNSLAIANLAQLVNVLRFIVTNEESSYAAPYYYPFVMYQQMETTALQCRVQGKYYDSAALGNITEMRDVPYVDVTASVNPDRTRLVFGIVNRHPTSRAFVDIDLKNFEDMLLSSGSVLYHSDLLATNSFDDPERVKPKEVSIPGKKGKRFKLDLPQASVSLLVLEKI
jgi:alpha-N-arabinofuranosidase